jgi:tRNA 5-methylaminomethyl-2-thiouridine biosynthesis bifunctional protein
VVGAGLAGAATAHALAQRGCQVTVLEAALASCTMHIAPAAPSAGLPVALMAPHHAAVGKAPSLVSQLSSLGLAATTIAAQTLLVPGQDWQPCGALQRAGKLGPQAHWFGDAAWVKPAALVAAWLAHPGITLRSGAVVCNLRYTPSSVPVWQAFDAQGTVIAEAKACVLANAYQARALLERLTTTHEVPYPTPPTYDEALHPVAGQVVYGPWTPEWQALWPTLLPELAQHRRAPAVTSAPSDGDFCAVNGNGHFIPFVPWGKHGERIWLSGSTYEHDAPQHPQVTPQGMAANLHRLQQLIPAAAALLAAQQGAGLLRGWAGTRCTTQGRLPWVGAVSPANAPGLYACTAMGSRGLSFAALCGQHIASVVMHSQDSPLPSHLQTAISPNSSDRTVAR